jgi:hypothetical protein
VLVNVITSNVVPPALIVPGVNDLAINGRLGATVSTSTAVQVPLAQPAPVLVTPPGTEMVAVFVTCVCAIAMFCVARRTSVAMTTLCHSAPNNFVFNLKKPRRLNTFFLQKFKTIPIKKIV